MVSVNSYLASSHTSVSAETWRRVRCSSRRFSPVPLNNNGTLQDNSYFCLSYLGSCLLFAVLSTCPGTVNPCHPNMTVLAGPFAFGDHIQIGATSISFIQGCFCFDFCFVFACFVFVVPFLLDSLSCVWYLVKHHSNRCFTKKPSLCLGHLGCSLMEKIWQGNLCFLHENSGWKMTLRQDAILCTVELMANL